MLSTIVYSYDPKECKVVSIKIDYTDPEKLEALARVAKIHVAVVEAFKRDSKNIFEDVELDLPNLPVRLKVIERLRD